MRSTSGAGHQFSRVPRVDIQRSSFDRSFGYKTTFDAGYLIPFFVDEVLPGDTFNVSVTAFARLATPIKPLMDNMMMDTFFFAVPMRLLWENWEKFNGAQDNPDDSIDFTVPTLAPPAGGYTIGSLGDYFGLPVLTTGFVHSAMWHRAYVKIYNEWFRDQNLQDMMPERTGDAGDVPAEYFLLRRGKRHDYFTSSLPWPQKGDSVVLPLGSTADVVPTGDGKPSWTGPFTGSVPGYLSGIGGGSTAIYRDASDVALNITGATRIAWLDPKLEVDLTTATAASINELRQAFQIQRMLERDARGGTRYTEVVRAHFGVTSPDARMQRPEYLGGGSTPILISPISQTSESPATPGTDDDTPQGNLAAIGTASFSGHGFVKSFTEHCVLIGLVSVRADLTYQQGLERMWSRSTRYDFYWPALAHIGEQAVLNKEIYLANDAADEEVWGYQERYAEYRYKPSRVTGLFRSAASGNLDVWHLAQNFSSRPALNDVFIREDPPIDRVIAVPAEPHFLFDSYTRMKCARPMPVYGVPGLIDHF